MSEARSIRVAAAVVWRGDELLLTQRPPGGPIGLRWEFPGGKIESGETPEHALEREIAEELGVAARAGRTLATEQYSYAHGLEVEIVFIECALDAMDFTPSAEVHALQWLRPDQVPIAELLDADREFVRRLAAERGAAPAAPAHRSGGG